jgi:tetratricopeptide (TPR) repeat protein
MKDALAIHDQIIRSATASHEGVVFKTGGDSFCISFASPHRALQSAIAVQSDLLDTQWETEEPIKVRMALHTGTAQLRDNDYFGPTLNRTARLMSVGHGGQILCSSSTQHLLADEVPAGVEITSLGIHHLKDLDRPEEIFQVTASGLPSEFPSLRLPAEGATGLGEEAVLAYREKDWNQVVELLSKLEADQELTAQQHEMMGFALWWLGMHDKVFRRFEQTYNAYISEDDPRSAAIAAVELADMHHHNLSPDLAAGWISRAARLLADDEDSTAKGYLLRWQSGRAFEADNDLEKALSLSRRVGEIGRARSDGNLEVLALQDQGRFLVASGRLDEGMPLMDEAMTAAMAGDVKPSIVGRSYCNMLAVCDKTRDVRRAAEWSEAAERWCREAETSPYPGICRVYKAELLWLNGKWVEAESEVKKASSELGLYTDVTGEAWYQFGVMRLRAGDYEGADAAFQEALTRGREPVPGYAYVLARRGETASAVDLIQRSLSHPALSKLDRARFLSALIELTVDLGDLDTATAAVDELEEAARLARSDFYKAQTAHARGIIGLAAGDPTAVAHLRTSIKTFTELGLPYEAARARSDLASAYIGEGAKALAEMELKSALATFQRLGSDLDVADTKELLDSTLR